MFLGQLPPSSPPSATEVSPLTVTGVKPGTAVLVCTIKRDRSLERCSAVSADPENCGFRTAALRLAEHLHVDAQAIARAQAGKVQIPLSFSGIGGCPRPDTP